MSVQSESPTYDSKGFKNVPFVESTVILNEEEQEVVIFAVNRSEKDDMPLDIVLDDFEGLSVIEATELAGYDPKQTTKENHEAMAIKNNDSFDTGNSSVSGKIKPLSWNMIRLSYK